MNRISAERRALRGASAAEPGVRVRGPAVARWIDEQLADPHNHAPWTLVRSFIHELQMVCAPASCAPTLCPRAVPPRPAREVEVAPITP